MKTSNHQFDISFVGLKIGKHNFNYQIDSTFFDGMDYSPISNGNLEVNLELEKKETMFIAIFDVKGTVVTDCDRCNTPLELPVHGDLKIIYKFGHEASEDENLIVLPPEAYKINVKDPIYQMIVLALPIRRVHPEGKCDEEMKKLLQKYTVNSDEKEDDGDDEGKWTILKNKN